MSNKKAKALLDKYLEGNCTTEEKAIVESWYNQINKEESKFQLKTKAKTKQIWPWLSAAAAILVFVWLGQYIQRDKTQAILQRGRVATIIPGTNKAYLTLADGTKIALTDSTNTQLPVQAGVKVTKIANGQLVYTILDQQNNDSRAAIAYNTIETPRGGQYRINLPDGTNVWLNAASSLKFPVSFSSLKERKVELSGEGYFEVAHNKSLPFRVIARNQLVEVYGTHFNINSYTNEARIKTTLLEGSIGLSTSETKKPILLKPGQQASYVVNSPEISIESVDADLAVAWKEGYFMFDNEKLGDVMRRLARWYNIEVVYEDPALENGVFYGTMSRYTSIDKVLKKLESATNLEFKTEGNQISILKKRK